MRHPLLLLLVALLAGPVLGASIQLPPETTMYPASSHPGYPTALQQCLICHSADYVAMQPNFSAARWREIADKIRTVFKAPITPAEVAQVASGSCSGRRRTTIQPAACVRSRNKNLIHRGRARKIAAMTMRIHSRRGAG